MALSQPEWIYAFIAELNRACRSLTARDLQMFFDKEESGL